MAASTNRCIGRNCGHDAAHKILFPPGSKYNIQTPASSWAVVERLTTDDYEVMSTRTS